MDIKIIKRDGSIDDLDITKIQKETKDAVAGLAYTNQSELELDSKIQFRNNMKSSEIQQTLIKTAVSKIDIDRPNWTFVASRLFLYDLYHKVGRRLGTEKGNRYGTLSKYLSEGVKEGRISELFVNIYSKEEIETLSTYIKPERDEQFNYLGVKTLYDRYIIKDKEGEPMELPQHMFMGIAMFLAQREEDKLKWSKKFYDMISLFEVMLATPTLSNARTTRHQLSSCYIGSTPDNIEGIFDSYKEMALLSKFGGGIGWDWTTVRSGGSFIDNHKNAAGGTIPFLKITNDIAVGVDQLGTRKGAIAVYTEPWHKDFNDFLDLKKNSGEERRRGHDLFPALWINDMFMKRVQENGNWTLFDPYEAPELSTLYGEAFEKKYLELENDPYISKDILSAKEMWKKILTSYFETGSPFLCFKDNANRSNPNPHTGVIRSSNLCTEIFQNTSPDIYKIKIWFLDTEGKEYFELYDEEEILTVDFGIKMKANKITSLHTLNDKQIFNIEKERIEGKTAVCNLASVNLSKINTKKDIERIVPVAIRALDNVIDLNFYPLKKVKKTNLATRSIGLGVMGEAQMLAEAGIEWGSLTHFNKIDHIMEMVSYNAINSSSDISKEKGSYPEFNGSNWSKGIFPKDFANEAVMKLTTVDTIYDWSILKEKVINQGVRNGYMMAIAPTSSISILTGTTQAIEPVFKRKWFEENLSGLIPVVVPNLSPDTWAYYTPAYDIDQLLLIRAAAIRQKWIDQGQSLNIFVKLDNVNGKILSDIYMESWKLGNKSNYYLRSQSPEASGDVEDRSTECVGCQ